MKVYSIFLNDNEGHVILCHETEKQALDFFKSNDASPVIEQDIDLSDVKVEIYPENTLITTLTKPAIISYSINL